MGKANLSWILLVDHLSFLESQDFVHEKTSGNRKRYSLTGKGIELVGAYLNLIRETIFDIAGEYRPAGPVEQREHLESGPESEALSDAFGVDGRRAVVVARMMNRERHKPNA